MKKMFRFSNYGRSQVINLAQFLHADVVPRGQYFFVDVVYHKNSNLENIRNIKFLNIDEAVEFKNLLYDKVASYNDQRITWYDTLIGVLVGALMVIAWLLWM